MYKNKFILFEVWKDCNNNCKFCFNRKMKTNVDTLSFISSFLDESILQYDRIGLVGGEIFALQLDNIIIKEKFYMIIDKICKLLLTDNLVEFYISAALIYDMHNLLEFLNYMNSQQLIDKLILCTSYDTIGRFSTFLDEYNWKNNMLFLHNLFPSLKIHTEMILTDDLINKITSNEICISNFSLMYNTSVDFLEPFASWSYSSKKELLNILPNFFTTRKKFMSFLVDECINKQKINILKLFIPLQRANYLYFELNNHYVFILNRHDEDLCFKLSLNGLLPKLGYIDSDIRMLNDVAKIRNMVN